MSSGVVFLDFDGPIFPNKSLWLPENELHGERIAREMNLHPYVNYWKADPYAVLALNKLYNYQPFDLVISSSWADDWLHQKSHIEKVLNANNFNYSLHPDWRTPRVNCDRHEQISDWLKLHPEVNNKYLILDDLSSGAGLADSNILKKYNLLKSNIILVNIDDGISFNDYKKMVSILSNWF